MNHSRRRRLLTVALATAALIIVTVDTTPTTPSIPESRPEPPSPEEVMVLEELLDWVRGAPRSTGFEAVGSAGLADAVRSRPQSFELFRTYNGKEDRGRLLETMPYGRLIRRAARKHSVDGLLIAAVIEAESGFDPAAVSPDGALGLMQIMPSTARLFGKTDYLEPAVNVDLGARYLSWLLRHFDGDVALALAAYNAGPGNVARFDGVPPFSETRIYLERVLSRYVDHHQRLWKDQGAGAWLS